MRAAIASLIHFAEAYSASAVPSRKPFCPQSDHVARVVSGYVFSLVLFSTSRNLLSHRRAGGGGKMTGAELDQSRKLRWPNYFRISCPNESRHLETCGRGESAESALPKTGARSSVCSATASSCVPVDEECSACATRSAKAVHREESRIDPRRYGSRYTSEYPDSERAAGLLTG